MINISALMLGIAIDSNFSANVLYTRRTEPQKGWGSGSGGGAVGYTNCNDYDCDIIKLFTDAPRHDHDPLWIILTKVNQKLSISISEFSRTVLLAIGATNRLVLFFIILINTLHEP